MSEFDYQKEAVLTASNSFHGDLVSLLDFKVTLENAVRILNDLDKIKKAFFYGKASEDFIPIDERSCGDLLQSLNVDIIHSIIGKATEAGEQLELLLKTINGEKFDETNFKEEIGDGLWYDALGLTAIGSNFDEVQRANIAKLRARFPNRFTEYDANNRDLKAERQILEG